MTNEQRTTKEYSKLETPPGAEYSGRASEKGSELQIGFEMGSILVTGALAAYSLFTSDLYSPENFSSMYELFLLVPALALANTIVKAEAMLRKKKKDKGLIDRL